MDIDDIDVIRRLNTRALANQAGSDVRFAKDVNREPGQVGHWIGKTPTKALGKKLARHIETSCSKEKYWLDKLHPELYPDEIEWDQLSLEALVSMLNANNRAALEITDQQRADILLTGVVGKRLTYQTVNP